MDKALVCGCSDVWAAVWEAVAVVSVLDVCCSGDGDGSGEMGEGIVSWMAGCCWGLMGTDSSGVGAGAASRGDCVVGFVGELGGEGIVGAGMVGQE